MTKRSVRFFLYASLFLVDCLAIFVGFLAASRISPDTWTAPHWQLGFLVTGVYAVLAINRNAFTVGCLQDQAESLRRSLSALFLTMLIALLFSFYLPSNIMVSRMSFAVLMGICAMFLAASRASFYYYTRNRYPEGFVDTLLIVDGKRPASLLSHFTVNAQLEGIEPDLHNPVMLSRLAKCLQGFDRAIISCPQERQYAWSLLLKGANIRGEIVMEERDTAGAIGIDHFGGFETLIVSRGPLSMANRAKKRLLDLSLTVPTLIALAPLFAIIALAIKLDSRGPVFFRQQRIGRSNELFSILKFRSMRTEMCDTNGDKSTERDDSRITRVGSFIRKTSIDELPQLINVLRGDMSLVGPRPHALGSLADDRLFWEVNEKYWIRHALKPGITGLAQIRGYRGATPQREDLENRLSADLEYVNNWRLWKDMSILIATLKVLIHRNAY